MPRDRNRWSPAVARSIACCLAICVACALSACGGGYTGGSTPREIADAEAQTAENMRVVDADIAREERRVDADDVTAAQTPAPPPVPASAPAGEGVFSAADRRSFTKLAGRLPGREGVAVSGLKPDFDVQRLGSLRSGVAWSTAKVPVAMAAINAGVADQGSLVAAITASDNAAAERLWSALGRGRSAADAATAQLRAAGDTKSRVQSDRLRAGYTAFGQTAWALTDQVRFTAGMACTAAGKKVLKLMNRVVAGQRWGLGATGNPAQFKGGWGPGISPGSGDGWLDRQMGIVVISGRPLAVTIATDAGNHDSGTRALTALARWVASHAGTKGLPRRSRC